MRQQEPDFNEIAFRIVQVATAEKPVEELKLAQCADEQAPAEAPAIKDRPDSERQGRMTAG